MFIILIFFPIILTLSYITTRFLLRIDFGPFSKFFWGLRFFGVIIHELSHFIMCLIVGLRPVDFKVRLRSKNTGKIDPNGSVSFEGHNGTFLQVALVSLAPLFFSTWLFFLFLWIALFGQIDPFWRILAAFLCFSIFFGATPSKPDLENIGRWFKKDPKYSLYQIFLLLSSGICVWAILTFYNITLIIDILYYLLVGIGYYMVKYLLQGFNWISNKILNGSKSVNPPMNYNRFKRSKFKPSKPSKLGKREPPW